MNKRIKANKDPMFILNNQSGGVAIIVGLLMLFVFMGIIALAVDVGYMMVTRNELQNIADGAALAGTRTLGRLYECNGSLTTCTEPMSYQNQLTYTVDLATITNAIDEVVSRNRAGGMSGITINAADIVIGNWNASTKILSPTLTSPDAVRVTARRDGSANGPIMTFFAKTFGINTVNVSAIATAALTGESTVGEGGLPIPVGIPTRWFQGPPEAFCDKPITFYPPCNKEPCDASGCAGYTTYTDWPSNAAFLKNTIMPGIPSGAYKSPPTEYGTMYNFTGGTLSALMESKDPAFITLFDTMKLEQYDHDGNNNTWTAKVPVYESDTCANPNQAQKIVGFATVVITNVVGPPNPTVQGTVKCDFTTAGRGGGGSYGTKGSIPGLVQ